MATIDDYRHFATQTLTSVVTAIEGDSTYLPPWGQLTQQLGAATPEELGGVVSNEITTAMAGVGQLVLELLAYLVRYTDGTEEPDALSWLGRAAADIEMRGAPDDFV
jgi:hypothetical protein